MVGGQRILQAGKFLEGKLQEGSSQNMDSIKQMKVKYDEFATK